MLTYIQILASLRTSRRDVVLLVTFNRPHKPTLIVVKKNSPGESCRNLTPCCATGASKKTTKSLEKQKQVSTAVAAAKAATMTLSLSSSKWSHIGMLKSSGRSSGSGYKNFCMLVFSSGEFHVSKAAGLSSLSLSAGIARSAALQP